MLIKDNRSGTETILDKRRLDSLGVLLPIRLHALSFFPGRHPLGRAGEGMRFLRTRPYEAGHDNPRDIDRFSPEGEYWINEWESEAQAAIRIYVDMSGSMNLDAKLAVRNLALLQLTYSLWRASDRVRTVLYDADSTEVFDERNLKSQLDSLAERLSRNSVRPGLEALTALSRLATGPRAGRDDLSFLVSDFCPATDAHKSEDPLAWRAVLRTLSCDVVPVIVSFALSTEQVGAIKLWDPERNRQCLALVTPARAKRVNAKEAARVARIEHMFRSLGLDSLTLRYEHDVYPSLAMLARLRRRRRT